MKTAPKTPQTPAGRVFALAGLTSFVAVSNLSAAPVAYENFDYSGGTSLTTTTLNNGTGWDSAWATTGVNGFVTSGTGTSLYFDQTPALISDGSNHVFAETVTGNARDFTGTVDLGSQDLYFTALVRAYAGSTTGGASEADVRFEFWNGAGALGAMRGNVGITNGSLFTSGASSGYGVGDTAASVFADDTTYLLAMKRTGAGIFASLILADGNIGSLTEPVSWQVSESALTGTALTSLRFLAGGDGDGGIRVDELRIATDWDSAVSGIVIPEPSTYALLGGLLALGSVMMRRRK